MGILATIFGSGDIIKKGLDLIDDMHTSGEEEIAAKSAAKVALLNAYAPFKIAQRYLALMFGGVYLSSYLIVLIMTIAGKGNPDAVVKVLGDFNIGVIMLVIVTFYFGGGAVEGVIKNRGKS